MNVKMIGVTVAFTLCLLACVAGAQRVFANQSLLVPSADQLRYQLIGDEPIAGPDGQSLVNGWSVLVFKDRKEARCYVAFKQAASITAMEAATCPR
jgi:hypothetical protein